MGPAAAAAAAVARHHIVAPLPCALQGTAPTLRIAEIVSVAPHPKADRLRVCQVDAGGVSTVKVVTNAQNVEEGMKVVFAVS